LPGDGGCLTQERIRVVEGVSDSRVRRASVAQRSTVCDHPCQLCPGVVDGSQSLVGPVDQELRHHRLSPSPHVASAY